MPRYSTRSWRAFNPEAAAPQVAEAATAARRATVAAGALSPLSPGRVRVLGLDPGSRRTGFGVIDCTGSDARWVRSGCIEVAALPMAERLRRIHLEVRLLVEALQPEVVAIERVFVSRNVASALKLGQARGAALAALEPGTPLHEYAPRAIKLAVVGTGAAEKTQVAHMVGQILSLSEAPTGDAADALAIALCHAHQRRVALLTGMAAAQVSA
jgi:crossover junction endodeoxyribonuclease RuvC